MKNLTKEKLIKAGARAMLAKSYHAVGIQEILSAVEVPKGSFYHYFESKEDFGVAIIEYYGEQLAKSISTKLASQESSPGIRLKEYFLSIRDYYSQRGYHQGCLVAKLATEVAEASPRMRTALKSQFDQWCHLVAVCIQEGQQTGDIPATYNPEDLAEFIYSSWEGALIRMQVNHDVAALDNFIDYIFTYIIPLPGTK